MQALQRIAYLLERSGAPTYRVRAFRGAAATLAKLDSADLAERAATGRLRTLPGVGQTTEAVAMEALAGQTPAYLAKLEAEVGAAAADEGIVLTDHSPRLKVANGLTAERLRAQLDLVTEINERVAPFRILTGIEVDILDDGSLDQTDELLGRLDVVVASVHSKLRMESEAMTPRMIAAVRNPHVDILGHCTGRMVTGKGRPQSTFDADAVFAAAVESDTAVEINCRPERLDPPKALLRKVVAAGCKVSIDTDAHAPGQLEWQPYGCVRAAECGVGDESIVNAWSADGLLEWTASHH